MQCNAKLEFGELQLVSYTGSLPLARRLSVGCHFHSQAADGALRRDAVIAASDADWAVGVGAVTYLARERLPHFFTPSSLG